MSAYKRIKAMRDAVHYLARHTKDREEADAFGFQEDAYNHALLILESEMDKGKKSSFKRIFGKRKGLNLKD